METLRINNINDQKIKEEELIKRILSGEKQLFEILVRRNNQKLYRAIRSYLKDEAEIEDAMQNSYINSYTKLHQFKFTSSFSTWLVRIGINVALARIKEKGKLLYLKEDAYGSKAKMILEIPDNQQLNPQKIMLQNEAKQVLENAIDSLDSKYRAVYILREVEEMSHKEIAVALTISVANVKVRLHRAKSMLKEKLHELIEYKNVFEFGFSRCDRITENVMNFISDQGK